MGWQNDDGSHEGYLIGLVRGVRETPGGYRVHDGWVEVGADFDHESTDPAMRARREVSHVQVECSCGWRSHRMLAPLGTTWLPCCVVLPTGFRFEPDPEEAAYVVWKAHLEHGAHTSLTAAARALVTTERPPLVGSAR